MQSYSEYILEYYNLSKLTKEVFMKPIHVIFTGWLTGRFNKTTDIELTRKIILLNIGTLIIIGATVFLGFLALLDRNYILAGLDFFAIVLIGGTFLHVRKSKNYELGSIVSYTYLAILVLYNFATGGIQNAGFIWVYILPPLAPFLFGLKKGTVYLVLLIMGEILLVAIPNPLYTAHYTNGFIIRYFFSLIAVFGITLFFESLSTQIQNKLKEKNEEFIHTINNLIETQNKLKMSEQRFRETADLLPTVICEFDMHQGLLYANKMGFDLFGYSETEIQPGFNILTVIKPEDRERVISDIEWLCQGEKIGPREYTIITKDGRELFARVDSALILINRQPVGIRCGITNITEQKKTQNELAKTAQTLAERNLELQEFTYIASHDLQEPLRKITVFSERLIAQHGEQLADEGRDYLQRMQKAASRMQNLIQDLLAYSRISTRTQQFTLTDLNTVLQEVLLDLEIRVEQTHGRIEPGKLPVIEADSTQIRQLFQNLLSNALKFHKKDQTPTVRVYASIIEPPDNGIQFYEITVADNGIGIDESNFERIFGVFQRLHGRNEYEGTGVGLAICKKIVERHGGKIRAGGKLGEGAQFVIELPVKQMGT
jgi:PAS domain S-box-containing protein